METLTLRSNTKNDTARARMAEQLIRSTDGRVFGAYVRSRSGKERTFNAKVATDAFGLVNARNSQVTVIDVNARKREGDSGGFRTIALEGVRALTIDGHVFDLDHAFGPLS